MLHVGVQVARYLHALEIIIASAQHHYLLLKDYSLTLKIITSILKTQRKKKKIKKCFPKDSFSADMRRFIYKASAKLVFQSYIFFLFVMYILYWKSSILKMYNTT